jgi:hypothetical protein
VRRPIQLHVTATQPYRGRHWAPDDDELRDAATADSATETTPATDSDEVPQPVLVAAPTDSDADGSDTAPAAAEVEDAPAPRKRKLFAVRGGKAR